MRPWLRLVPILLLLVKGVLLAAPTAEGQGAPDYPITGGHFFTQTDGSNGSSGTGYAVSNADGIPFLDYFNRNGGVSEWGYPISHRFIYQGFTVQIFQKAGFQWNAGTVNMLNIFDLLSQGGYDTKLREQFQVPPPAQWPQDTGQPYSVVQQNHLKVLEADATISAAYYSRANWLGINGLPMAEIQTMSTVMVLRNQRSVFQKWLSNQPWASAGQVTVANGGDVAKALGFWPAWAVQPMAPAQAPLSAMVAPVSPTPTPSVSPTPNPANCAADEVMTITPASATPGQAVQIQVTSARASTNVTLTGAGNPLPQSVGVGGKGSLWTWTLTAPSNGSYPYSFLVSGTPCATATLTVGPTSSNLCNGDEAITFSPTTVNPGQAFQVQATSARASANVNLTGPGTLQLLSITAGGKGTLWIWNVSAPTAGSATYTFQVSGSPCASATLTVGGSTVSPVCYGDETIAFVPTTARPNQQVQVQATSARASANVALTGPNNPQLQSITAGGKGTFWVWTLLAPAVGTYTYTFTIEGQPCASNTLTVNNTSVSTVCYGDEAVTAVPASPSPNTSVQLQVTSARASANVSMNGVNNPVLQNIGPGGKGTIWTYSLTAPSAGSYTYTFAVEGSPCATSALTVGSASYNSAVCNGDESIAVLPASPSPGQSVQLQVTSARASANVSMNGVNNPVLQSIGPGGKGTIWTYSLTAPGAGSYTYTFAISGSPCAAATVSVGSASLNTAVCNGDEALTFVPTNPNPGQSTQVQVTSARPSANVSMNGVNNPQLQSIASGGKGTIWTWSFSAPSAGSYTYIFQIAGTPCASGTLTVSGTYAPSPSAGAAGIGRS